MFLVNKAFHAICNFVLLYCCDRMDGQKFGAHNECHVLNAGNAKTLGFKLAKVFGLRKDDV